jgi:predicted flap endonuclease-1-like 5' DNA nuclease
MRIPSVGLRPQWSTMAGGALMLISMILAVITLARAARHRYVGLRTRSEARAALEAVAEGKARAAGSIPSSESGDDLKVIEGIGPRVEGVLHAAGIDSFARLASMRPGRIETILREAGGRMANPRSWPRQAALAAQGRWDELRRLQDRLDRGAVRARAGG